MRTPHDDEPLNDAPPGGHFCPYCGQPLPEGFDKEVHPPIAEDVCPYCGQYLPEGYDEEVHPPVGW